MISHEQFERLVREGIEALPLWVREKMVNVAILIEDEPSARVRKEEGLDDDETLFGYYEGVPLIERSDEPPLMPDTITIYKKPVLETYEKEEDLRASIENTIWHEVAHYFGHGEEWVAEEEKRRGKIL